MLHCTDASEKFVTEWGRGPRTSAYEGAETARDVRIPGRSVVGIRLSVLLAVGAAALRLAFTTQRVLARLCVSLLRTVW